MKFKDAKLDMKVISDGPLKIKGTIVAIDDKYRNVRVKGERVTLWFFEKPNEPDSEYDLAYLKVDPKAKLVGNPPKFDIGLMDSDEFIKYVWTLVEKYEKEFLPDQSVTFCWKSRLKWPLTTFRRVIVIALLHLKFTPHWQRTLIS